MQDITKFIQMINGIQGSIIAVVYTFEGEHALGFKHYDVWRSEVISDWIKAIEELRCKPYIIDVRTFILKAMMETLPHIDFIINLNAGNTNLDNLGLVPAVCSFIDIPCIPCGSSVCSVGEDKNFANMIAKNSLIKVPEPHPYNVEGGIIRPRCYGSSVGIRRTSADAILRKNELSQRFINGTDVTIPILFNPLSMKLEVLPAIAYIHTKDNNWYLGENEKLLHNYNKIAIRIPNDVSSAVLELVSNFDINTFCRVDTRVESFNNPREDTISLDNIYFIEINPTPTIHNNINFANAIYQIDNADTHYDSINIYKTQVKNWSPTGYVLACAICAIKAMRYQSLD